MLARTTFNQAGPPPLLGLRLAGLAGLATFILIEICRVGGVGPIASAWREKIAQLRSVAHHATVKHLSRYWRDPQFRAAIDREKARARLECEQKGWITYAIHDPTTPDHVGAFNTLIVYVGQSKDFASRVDRRLREAGTATHRPTSYVEGLMYDIMRRGGVPRFRVIARVDDGIASFVSETNWAQHYIAQGYPLRNKWNEQRRPGETMTRDTVPHKWLWRLAVEDAIEARFTIVAIDQLSGKSLKIDLAGERPKDLLRAVRSKLEMRMCELGAQPQFRLLIEGPPRCGTNFCSA